MLPTPYIPSEQRLYDSEVPDKVVQLVAESAKLTGQLAPVTLRTIQRHTRVINSYYSNLIEGNATLPYQIRAAQRGQYEADLGQRNLQIESLAHMQVQAWIEEQQPDVDTLYTPAWILTIHNALYSRLPDELRTVRNAADTQQHNVLAGQWRDRHVIVGNHIPPDPAELEGTMQQFCETYNPARYRGDQKLIAVMAAHHRFLWVHPFSDGNGRVGRLLTDATLRAMGLQSVGVWQLSRGLARAASAYKSQLAAADAPRWNDYDGRGQLSEAALLHFCEFMTTTALDQVRYVQNLLELPNMKRRIDGYIQARKDARVTGIDAPLPQVASTVLYSAFVHGELQRHEALELCGMHERSARRLLHQLRSEGLLSETSSRSPLRWEIPEHAEPWYFPQLAPQA